MKKNFSAYTDLMLIESLKGKKDESDAAFTEIYDRYAARVFAYCRRVINHKEVAEDIFQETFIRFYQNVKTDHPKQSIIGFLITIARNLCLNYQRDNKQNLPIESIGNLFADEQSYENKELTELAVMALELLEPDYKEALILRLYNGLDYHQIGEIMEISPNSARVRVHRAKEKIRNILLNYEKDLFK